VRSPARIVLDRHLRLPPKSELARSARRVPLFVTAASDADERRRTALADAGASFLAVEAVDDHIALPELVEDLAARGISTLMVEGGAYTAAEFLEEGLVDRLCLFIGAREIGPAGIASPVSPDHMPSGFRKLREAHFGDDRYIEYVGAD
jgi:diaminohydroxyphosphoribosylaminopyrimidine deaminase / 5-amino-6-(5-phosphoribosylamino)uracil reductase